MTIIEEQSWTKQKKVKMRNLYYIICVIGTIIKLKCIQIAVVLKVSLIKSHFKIRIQAL